ncbi:hypothetical protein LUZ61_009183 [Rhynchospora tenuis]|uniref:Major facilitator superfamily (MFS) profile domain-containing protein n=1 Tax=Rhynchospora tenuis TaxID=198213 RepID=A0AAD6EYE4_9POAL|nr:hypothetical protein LUZ61_009183 [Rhynchospora tenuis]
MEVWREVCHCSFSSGPLLFLGFRRDQSEPMFLAFGNERRRKDDLEDIPSSKLEQKSSASVLPYVGVACLGATLFGYHLGVVNGALEYLAKDLGIAENTILQGWIVSTSLAGPLQVSKTETNNLVYSSWLHALYVTELIYFGCSATSQDVRTMIVGCLLAGVGIGISSGPLYISEISPTEIRGALCSINQLFICIGILAALVAGLPLPGNPAWWRSMFGIAVIPSILLALGMLFSPESPRWLFQQRKIAEAETTIKRLYGKEKVAEIMLELKAGSMNSTEPDANWLDLFSGRYWKGTHSFS